MKIQFALVALAFLGGMAVQEPADDKPLYENPWGDDPMANPEFMAAWAESFTPGEPHQEFAQMAGNWNVETKTAMAPEGELMPGTATAKSRTILGGRWLMEEFTSDFMGQKFEGVLLLGYDNLKQEYVSIWLDSMSTWPSIARGQRNAEGEMEQCGTMFDVISPNGRPYKHISRQVSENQMHARMVDTLPDGREWTVMEMAYTRAE